MIFSRLVGPCSNTSKFVVGVDHHLPLLMLQMMKIRSNLEMSPILIMYEEGSTKSVEKNNLILNHNLYIFISFFSTDIKSLNINLCIAHTNNLLKTYVPSNLDENLFPILLNLLANNSLFVRSTLNHFFPINHLHEIHPIL